MSHATTTAAAASNPAGPTALIAEDEPLLAQALQAALAKAWPALRIAATVGDGESAVREALALRPDVLFFDVRMPGMDGLEAAAALADDWPADEAPFPALVFVTAYDQYAVEAFEAHAVDYVLKPVLAARLDKTVQRVQALLAARAPAGPGADLLPAALAQFLAAPHSHQQQLQQQQQPAPPLRLIPASLPGTAHGGGSAIRMVPIDTVLAFEAADKYVRVLTAEREYLIRTPLKELLPQLDPETFWQVHRGTLVRAEAIDTVVRDEAGKLHLAVRGLSNERFGVSRLYAGRFRAM